MDPWTPLECSRPMTTHFLGPTAAIVQQLLMTVTARVKRNAITLSCAFEHFRGCDFDGVEVRCIYNSSK